MVLPDGPWKYQPFRTLSPCPSHHSCWMNMSSTPNPRFGFSQCVLVPISLVHAPLFIPPEVHPCCSCPHMAPVHPHCTPDLVSRRTDQQLRERRNIRAEFAASGRKEQKEEQAEDEQQNYNNPDDKLPAMIQANETAETIVFCGSQPSLDEETLAELAFQEFMSIMDSLSPKVKEGAETKENTNEGDEKETGDSSFLEFLNKLSSDEELFREFGLTSNIEHLDPPLSSDPEPIDFIPLREVQQEPLEEILEQLSNPVFSDSTSVSAESLETFQATSTLEALLGRAQSPSLDPPGSQSDLNQNHDGQTLFIEEPLSNNATETCFNVPRGYDGSLFMDESFTHSTSSVSESNEDPRIIPIKDLGPISRSDMSTVSPQQTASPPAFSVLARKILNQPAQIKEPGEQDSTKKINPNPMCLDDNPMSAPANLALIVKSIESCDLSVLSDSVPERKTLETPKDQEVSQECASSGFSLDLRAGELSEMERNCDENQGRSPETTATQKQTSLKSRQGQTKETHEGIEENKLKGTSKTRRSQRLSGQTEKQEARLSNPGQKSSEKMAKFTPDKDVKQKRRSSRGTQLHERVKADSEEQSQATKTAGTTEQALEMAEMNQQKLKGEVQELKAKARGQSKDNISKLSTEDGADKAEEDELDEGRVKEEGIPKPSPVRKRTRSTTTEEDLQPSPPPERVRRDKRSEDNGKRGDETEPKTLLVLSPMKRSKGRREEDERRETDEDAYSTGCKTNKDKVSGYCSPESSRQSPGDQSNTHDQSREGSPYERPSNKLKESPSLSSLETKSHFSPMTCSETRRPRKTIASIGNVTGAKTLGFYNLRSAIHSPNVSKKTEEDNEVEVKDRPPNFKPGQDQKSEVKDGVEGMNGGDAGCQSLTWSPTKRYRDELDASEKRETRGMKTGSIRVSPLKKGRWRNRLEGDEKQESTVAERGQEGSGDQKSNPPPTGSHDKKIASLSRKEVLEGGERSVMKTRSSCKGNCITCFSRRSTQLSERFPAKYKTYIVFKKRGHKRRLRKKTGRAREGKHI